jgi:hypothetical protein
MCHATRIFTARRTAQGRTNRQMPWTEEHRLRAGTRIREIDRGLVYAGSKDFATASSWSRSVQQLRFELRSPAPTWKGESSDQFWQEATESVAGLRQIQT